MEIIFTKLPKFLDFLCVVIRKLGFRVFYLELAPGILNRKKPDYDRVVYLQQREIIPLPLSELPDFHGFSEINYDPEMKVFKHTEDIAPLTLIIALQDLFPNITNTTKKLQIAIHSTIAPQYMTVTSKINIWANANKEKTFLLVDMSSSGYLNVRFEPNIRQLIIPFDLFISGASMIIGGINSFFIAIVTTVTFSHRSQNIQIPQTQVSTFSKVAFVVHKGLNYGNLFQKDLFYSTRIDSDLHPERLVHIDYNGWPSPSEKLIWVNMGNHRESPVTNLYCAVVALSKSILHIRHLKHLFGLLILLRFYVIFKSYSRKIENYPDLKIALIDYDFLCPKELVMAFESKGIKTIATQERFIASFGNLFSSIIMHQYLCNSQYVANEMKKSKIKCIDQYIPVGQYRTDILLKAKQAPPPKILDNPISKNLKIITALGFHTHMEWQNSQLDPILNWNAHRHFLEDMIQLSHDIPGIFIILRYKDVDWLSLPVFSNLVQRIQSSDKIVISSDYEKYFLSYDLCAHSDLVIAKHTSLADECLSVGIPVLFHEYSHNSERIAADAFDYSPARVMCFNYEELKERTQIILSGTPNEMTADFDYLKREVFGGLGDGKVTERIHAHIEKILLSL